MRSYYLGVMVVLGLLVGLGLVAVVPEPENRVRKKRTKMVETAAKAMKSFPSEETKIETGRQLVHKEETKRYSGYTFWSSDFHISPVADLKELFGPMGMQIIDESLSGHCGLKKTCARNLKVLNRGNGIDLRPCPNQLRRKFFQVYKNDERMRKVDAFLCHHAAGMCEVFMPFNASLIVVVSTRYEIGRHDPARWRAWNANLRAIAQDPRNIIAANNRYDAEYLKYFTGLKDVPVIPNYCGYVGVSYNPKREQILVGPGRGIKENLFRALDTTGKPRGLTFKRIRDLYPHFEYSDLAAHPAVVLIPYQVSIMSIFEYYRMALPMFAPSPKLLAQWQVKFKVISERSWNLVRNKPHRGSPLPAAPEYSTLPDPNNEVDARSIEFWIKFADFYQWPHIITFDSFDHLCTLIKTTDLAAVSAKIKEYNLKMKTDLQRQWQSYFHKMFHGLPPAATQRRHQILDYDKAMADRYRVRVPGNKCVGDLHGITTPSPPLRSS